MKFEYQWDEFLHGVMVGILIMELVYHFLREMIG